MNEIYKHLNTNYHINVYCKCLCHTFIIIINIVYTKLKKIFAPTGVVCLLILTLPYSRFLYDPLTHCGLT
jgi:hypothetical protein